MNAQQGRSSGDSPRPGATDFAAAADSPVRTDSSHSRPFASISRRSAGTMSPTAGARRRRARARRRRLAAPGHRARQGPCGGSGVECLDRLLGAVLVDEAEPDTQCDDREDDPGGGRRRRLRPTRPPPKQGARARSCGTGGKARSRSGRRGAQDVRAELVQPTPGLLAREPTLAAAETVEHRLWLEHCGCRKVEACARHPRRGELDRLHWRIVAPATRSDPAHADPQAIQTVSASPTDDKKAPERGFLQSG